MAKLNAWTFAPLAAAAMIATLPAQAQTADRVASPSLWDGGTTAMTPATSNTSAPSNWRLTAGKEFNGVSGAFDGTALLLFTTTEAAGTFACSGSLMKGGEYVLTAAHCVDGLISMSVQFGYTNNVALQTRTVTQAVAHPGWNGSLDTGADIALVKLSAPVTNLPQYTLSTSNDVGKQYIMTGYGSTTTGGSNSPSSWGDSAYGHYGYNTFDTESSIAFGAWDATHPGAGTYTAPAHGATYVSDFDYYNASSTLAQRNQYNTLQRMADASGGGWTSGTTLGTTEALIAGGDSGGGDFIWNGTEWVLSAVHSWGWQFCGGRITSPSCDFRTGNDTSYGDISGSTAVFSHTAWINSVIAAPVPEPETYALMLAGLAVVAGMARRRRRAA